MPRGPRTSASGTRIGGGPSSGGAQWNPAIGAPFAWFDGDVGVTGTAPATSWVARAGSPGALTTGAGVPLSAALLNTHKGFTLAANSALNNTTAAAFGTNPWTAYSVGRFTALGPTVVGNLALLGNSAGNVVNKSGVIGATYQNHWWAGGYNGADALPNTGTADTNYHIFCTDFDGTTVRLIVDNQIIATHTHAFNLAAGIGIENWFAGGFGTTGELYTFLVRAGVDSDAVRRQHIAWFSTHYGLTMPDCATTIGDSLNVIGDYPGQLSTLINGAGWKLTLSNFGVNGATTTDTLAAMATDGTDGHPAIDGFRNRFLIIESGANDFFANNAIAPAVTAANYAAMRAAGLAAGYFDVLFVTPLLWVNGHPLTFNGISLTSYNAALAWQIANVPADHLVRADLIPEFALVSGGTNYNGTDRIANVVGDGTVGHFTTHGAGLLAAAVQTKITALRRP